MPAFKLTDHLLAKYSAQLKVATTHPFLQAAGRGSIDKDVLTAWLRQDYLYAYIGYVKFASLLLSRVPLSASPPLPSAPARIRALARAVPLLTFSLSNVVRETNFFASTAASHGLDLHPGGVMPPAPKAAAEGVVGLGEFEEVTKAYVDFLIATAAGGSVEEGLVVLWAMEKAYFDSWTHAKTLHKLASSPTQTQLALDKFIDNWTNEEFADFVNECGEVVDGLEIDPESEEGKRCEAVFARIVGLEQRFWPTV